MKLVKTLNHKISPGSIRFIKSIQAGKWAKHELKITYWRLDCMSLNMKTIS